MTLYSKWMTTPEKYVGEVRRWQAELGSLQWAAIQDWMCEPWMLKKTGLSVHRHQELTVQSYLTLKELAPDLPWVPVLQGWEIGDYLEHIDQYESALGAPLSSLPLVGLGSVCRRQATEEVEELVYEVAARGIRLHGFGFKLGGLRRVGHLMESADSLAWSRTARWSPPLPGCAGHKNCANCMRFATQWRKKVLWDVMMGEAEATVMATG